MTRFVIDVVICSSKDDQLQHVERGATITTTVAFIEKPKKRQTEIRQNPR